MAFSLYQKDGEDAHLLDVRICENGKTTVLLDYIIAVELQTELSGYWDYDRDSNYRTIEHNDPDLDRAFPKDMKERFAAFASQTQGAFVPVNYKNSHVPDGLIQLAEKALHTGDFERLNQMADAFEIDKKQYFNVFGEDENVGGEDGWIRENDTGSVHKYTLGGNTYYLIVSTPQGSGRFVSIVINQLVNGKLTQIDLLESFDWNAGVVTYENALYLADTSYNYYSKFKDTVVIYKLEPGGLEHYVSIQLLPDQFSWKNIYSNRQPYRDDVAAYVDEIKEDLMKKSPINDDIELYLGDETEDFDNDKRLRLKSVAGNYDFYEIDVNNDGGVEYARRNFWFPSNYTQLYLQNSMYQFMDGRVVELSCDFGHEDYNLIQLWFQKIGDKVFTFRLFLVDGYNYLLNISLMAGATITQVQSYLIAPKRVFEISTGVMGMDELE